MQKAPLFTVVSVAYNDVWALTKTAQSVFRQSCQDFEYIIVDGASGDAAPDLIRFWDNAGLVSKSVSEKDGGVYDAMNKGLDMASGDYVIFMNASDVFAEDDVLEKVAALLKDGSRDGVLGWGELNGQTWASWTEGEAFKMASLGFCHQALFVRRSLLQKNRFDDRPFKTDSDTRQLGQLFADGARISIIPEVLAIRGGEPGISANLDRTRVSICNTLTEEYPGLSEAQAEMLLAFRRGCKNPEQVLALLAKADARLAEHLAYTILDTLFQRQSKALTPALVDQLMEAAFKVLKADQAGKGRQDIQNLTYVQGRREALLQASAEDKRDLDRSVAKFEGEENNRIKKAHATFKMGDASKPTDMVVSMTSFPKRIKTVHFAIQSLMEQTYRPASIHLWLGRDEIPNENWLPGRLRALIERGLQVHFSDRTFYQYDKYLHNAALNADAPFVIVDDDVIYPPNSMEHLWEAHLKHPTSVVANRCHQMEMSATGDLTSYTEWEREVQAPAPSLQLLPTGAGGVLYPKGFLTDPNAVDVGKILSCAPYADDIWLKAIALSRGIPTVSTKLSHGSDWYHRYTPSMMAGTLMATNVNRGLNDTQVKACMNWVSQVRPTWKTEFQHNGGLS